MSLIFEVKTEKDFETAVTDLKKSLTENSFGVLWEMNFKEKLEEKGLDFKSNFKILEVCSPPRAKVILEQNLEAGYMLPCKMVVYEKEDGVRIGMMKPTAMAELMNDKNLNEVASEVETILRKAIDSSK
ncbi:MAG: DUF302 domain-containing protein [Clostridiaceae bacterium]